MSDIISAEEFNQSKRAFQTESTKRSYYGRRPGGLRVEGCTPPRIVLFFVFIAAVICAAITLQDSYTVGILLEWMRESQLQGLILFVVAYIFLIVLMVPGTLLCLCAGAMFKWQLGTALVWVGQTIGQTLAFILGRYMLREIVVLHVTSRYRKFAAVDSALEKEGWKLVVLLRLSPLIPWNILNYLLSITGINSVSYVVASAIAVLPWLSLFTYLGSMAQTLADVFNGNVTPDSSTSVLIAVVSGILLISAVLYTGFVSKRAISEAFRNSETEGVLEEIGLLAPRDSDMNSWDSEQGQAWTQNESNDYEPDATGCYQNR